MSAGQQNQTSRQSGQQGGQSGKGSSVVEERHPQGIGSTQGQEAPERPSAGTADIPRDRAAGDVERGGAGRNDRESDSMVGDSTGAFKERP